MPKYVMKISNGVCYPMATHAHLIGTAGYIEYDDSPTRVSPPAAKPSSVPSLPDVKSPRMQSIIDAIRQIDKENYAKPMAGRPAMPKVSAVSYLLGEKVTVDEVLEAMKAAGV